LFEDNASGAKDDRLGLNQALTFVRPGDVLVVWKLDLLGRSLSHLLCIVNALKEKQVSVAVIEMAAGVTTACFTPCSRAPVGASITLFFFLACIRLRQSNRPYFIFVYPKIRILHMQYYRVDEYMEIRIDRQAHFRLCVYLNIHNFT
jgi:hypothetical protein